MTSIRGKDYPLYKTGGVDAEIIRKEYREERKSKFFSPDLTHELWEKAKAGFIQHGGRPKGQGDLEPEKKAAPAPKPQAADPGKVKFVKEDRQNRMGATFIYRIHKAPDAASAKAFLEKNPVSQPLYYLVVETPEGSYCRDKDGIYKE